MTDNPYKAKARARIARALIVALREFDFDDSWTDKRFRQYLTDKLGLPSDTVITRARIDGHDGLIIVTANAGRTFYPIHKVFYDIINKCVEE